MSRTGAVDMSIVELLAELNRRFQKLQSGVLTQEEQLKAFAAELGLELRFCSLPWCRKAFIPKRKDHCYCDKTHKDEHRNKTRD